MRCINRRFLWLGPDGDETLHLRWTEDGRPICPVCGHISAHASTNHVYEETGNSVAGLPTIQPTYNICPSCGVEFGNEDLNYVGMSLEESWKELRKDWLGRSIDATRAIEQLRNLGD